MKKRIRRLTKAKTRAVFLLLSSKNEVERALHLWTSSKQALKNVREEIFAVSFDAKGTNFEAAVSKALDDGFESFVLIRFLPEGISSKTDKLPEIIEKMRRNFLHVDFHYAAISMRRDCQLLKNTQIKSKRK